MAGTNEQASQRAAGGTRGAAMNGHEEVEQVMMVLPTRVSCYRWTTRDQRDVFASLLEQYNYSLGFVGKKSCVFLDRAPVPRTSQATGTGIYPLLTVQQHVM